MGQIGVAITNLPTVIFLKKPFSDGLGGGEVNDTWVLPTPILFRLYKAFRELIAIKHLSIP
jgi:hypothetical protein